MNSVLLTPNPKSRSTGESDSGKVCIIHKHGRANYGTIQTLTIKRWEKIQEIKDIRSNAENEREQQILICERIPPVVDFAQHGYHHFCYNSFINTRNIKRKVSLEPEYEEWCSKSKRIKTNASSVLFPVQCIFCDKKTLWISQKTGKRKEDRLVKCVTKTAETSIKESVVRKGDERLKEHLENADLIAKEAWYHEFCRKTYTRKPQRNLPKFSSKKDKMDYTERKRHQSEEEEGHDGKSEGEIRSRIGLAKNAFSKRYKLLTNKNISLKTRLRLTKCYVWSLLTYACDIWTLSKQMEAKIEAFEMWSYRRITKISWKEMKGNAEVLKMIGLKNAELSRKGNWPIMDMYEGIITYKN